MSDTFGAIEFPVTSLAPVGDPLLGYIGDYLKTILNAKLQTAFTAAKLGEKTTTPVVREVFTVAPTNFVLDDCKLPSLFVWRPSGQFEQNGSDLFEDQSMIHVAWMLPHDRCRTLDPRRTFFNAIAKCIGRAIRKVRDPLWTYAADTEPGALTIAADTDSIVLSAATSVIASVVSGAGLNGAKAALHPYNPRLAPTVTTSTTVADCYNITTPIVWTVIDWYERTRTLSKTLTAIRGNETLTVLEDVKRIVSISIPAQLTALGTLQFGTAARAGAGSNLMTAINASTMRTAGWRAVNMRVEEIDASGQLASSEIFEAVEIDILVQETESTDISSIAYPLDDSGVGIDVDTLKLTSGEDDLLAASISLNNEFDSDFSDEFG